METRTTNALDRSLLWTPVPLIGITAGRCLGLWTKSASCLDPEMPLTLEELREQLVLFEAPGMVVAVFTDPEAVKYGDVLVWVQPGVTTPWGSAWPPDFVVKVDGVEQPECRTRLVGVLEGRQFFDLADLAANEMLTGDAYAEGLMLEPGMRPREVSTGEVLAEYVAASQQGAAH